jgi:hypothetical protein
MSKSAAPAPAYHIPLSDSELRLVGEIAAIQGQIEYLLGQAMQAMLDISTDAVYATMHSASLKINTLIFVTAKILSAPFRMSAFTNCSTLDLHCIRRLRARRPPASRSRSLSSSNLPASSQSSMTFAKSDIPTSSCVTQQNKDCASRPARQISI